MLFSLLKRELLPEQIALVSESNAHRLFREHLVPMIIIKKLLTSRRLYTRLTMESPKVVLP